MSCGSFRERRRESIFSVSLHLKDLITIEIIYRNALNVKRYTGRSTFVGIVFLLALWPAKAASELACRIATFVGPTDLLGPRLPSTVACVQVERVAQAETMDEDAGGPIHDGLRRPQPPVQRGPVRRPELVP